MSLIEMFIVFSLQKIFLKYFKNFIHINLFIIIIIIIIIIMSPIQRLFLYSVCKKIL